MRRAAIYVRISRDPGHDELGVRRQERDCRELCGKRGWPVVAVYADDDVSAFSGRRRPQYDAMLAALAAGDINAIVAWHPDRLHRSPRELESFIDAVEASKAQVATVQAGELDLSTPAGRMTARVVGAVARHESEHKSARLKRKALELAEAGKVSGGGPRPFGYEKDRLTVIPGERELVREAVRRVLGGAGLRGICNDWNRRGVPTVTGAQWTPHVLGNMLKGPRIAGLREHRGKVIGPAVWEGLVPVEDWHALVAILSDPRRSTLTGQARRYLLTGFAHCGLCGARLVARPRGDKRRCYVCATGAGFTGCGKIRILADTFEDFVVEAVMVAAASPELDQATRTAEGHQAVDVDEVGAEIAALERRQAELAEMWAAGELTRPEWVAARKAVQARLDGARGRVARSVVGRATDDLVNGALRDRWPDLALEQQRAVIQHVLADVTVGPAVKGLNRFDPRRIGLVWAV